MMGDRMCAETVKRSDIIKELWPKMCYTPDRKLRHNKKYHNYQAKNNLVQKHE